MKLDSFTSPHSRSIPLDDIVAKTALGVDGGTLSIENPLSTGLS